VQYAKITLKKGEDKRILAGHPWIYDNEVQQTEPAQPGDIVDVYSSVGRFLGRGYINPASKILVRLLTRKKEEIGREFFRRRVQMAWNYRRSLGFIDSCRLIYGEADLLPALIVDKFGDYLCVQILALGMDVRREMIFDVLEEVVQPKGIYERSDVPVREKEGLPQRKGPVRGSFDPKVCITENGIRLMVDLENGQKTGYFLDQRQNRAALAPYVNGARVLDTFCHTGGFALNAAKNGAAYVEAVDISQTAIDEVNENAAINGFTNITGVCANVFDLLREYAAAGKKFDVVVLDPPAFCKNKAGLKSAYRGYKEINLQALKIINEGGYLVTCSCSHYMTPALFSSMLADAAADSHRSVRVIEVRSQSPDHPILMGADETSYLKCLIAHVI